MPLAHKPGTGELLFLDRDKQWKPAETVTNPETGGIMAWDGQEWAAPPVDVAREINAVLGKAHAGIARVVGAPVDIANAALGGISRANELARESLDLPGVKPTGSRFPLEKPIAGSENIMDLQESIGIMPRARPETATGRVLGRTLEELGAGAATMGTTKALTAAADAGMIALGPRASSVAQTFASQPGMQALGTGGAGLGAGVAGELLPGSKGAEMVGMLSGGTIGVALTPALRYLYEGGQAFLQPLTAAGREDIVGRTLKSLASDPNALAAQAGRGDLRQYVPGSGPTTAQALNDPGLAAAERALRNNPETAAPFFQRDAESNLARREYLDREIPATAGAESTQRVVQAGVADYSRAMGEAIAAARQNVEQRLAALGPGLNDQQAGRIIREEYDAALDAMRQQVRRAYRGIDPEGASRIETGAIWDEAAATAVHYFGDATTGVPEQLRGILSRLRGAPQTFSALDRMAREADNIASIARKSGDGTLATAAGEMGRSIRGGLDDAAMAGAGFTPEQVAAYQTARGLRRQMGQMFEQGAVGSVGATKRFGEAALQPSELPAQFFHGSNGAAEDVEQFIASFGGDRSRAVQALQDYAIADLRRVVIDADGTVNPKRLAAWVQKHDAALRPFLDLRGRLNDVGTAQRLVDDLGGRQTRTVDEVRKSALGFFLDGADPDQAVRRLMLPSTKPSEVARLVSVVRNDPMALAGLRRAVLEDAIPQLRAGYVGDTLGEAVRIPWLTIKSLVNRDRRKLALIFGKDHLDAIQNVALDMARANASQSAGRIAGSNTIQNLSTANLIARLSAGTVNLTEGGQGLVGNIAGTLARAVSWAYKMPEQQVQQLLVDAMMDPQLAMRLAATPTPASLAHLTDMLVKRGFVTAGIAGTAANRNDRAAQGAGNAVNRGPSGGTAGSSGPGPESLTPPRSLSDLAPARNGSRLSDFYTDRNR